MLDAASVKCIHQCDSYRSIPISVLLLADVSRLQCTVTGWALCAKFSLSGTPRGKRNS